MPIALTNLTAEIQARCNALTTFSTVNAVIDCAVAAKKLEMAGGSINRTILDTELQRVITASGNGSLIEDLIALAASLEQRVTNGKTRKTRAFTTSGTWVKPNGVDSVEILLVGGGGGGGGLYFSGPTNTSTVMFSGSGGGGEVIKTDLDISSVAAGVSISITIGAAGPGGTTAGNSGQPGSNGGSSSFGNLLTALGGGGGDGYPIQNTVYTNIRTQGGVAGVSPSAIGGYPGLGAGAGGSPQIGVLGNNHQTFGVQYGASIAVGSTPSFYYSSVTPQPPICGPGLYGYGAGGGIKDYFLLAPEITAGGQFSLHAVPNSGSGGAGRYQNSTAANLVGGDGGSGFCLLTWWE